MYGFDSIDSKEWLRKPGIHTNAKFLGLSYSFNEQWEAFDIELLTSDGKTFRERTFGPTIDKVYPKDKYEAGKKVGTETKEEALMRVQSEVSKKLFYLAACFVSKETLQEIKAKTFKELVDAVKNAIGDEPEGTINFLTIWKNSDSRQKSNLIIAERIKWCELYQEGKTPNIKLSQWQQDNQMVEKYPYKNESESSNETLIQEGTISAPLADDLPF